METAQNSLPAPLYHGTSTYFIEGIIGFGLGGRNQLAEWNVFEFARALQPLVDEHLSIEQDWMLKAQSFGYMVEQRSAAMNFQHGDTYLSPSAATAVRYAVNQRFGSELLSYSLDFLQELLRRKISTVCENLYQDYRHLYELLNIPGAPLLISVEDASVDELVAENGGDATSTFNYILKTLWENAEIADTILQQSNFRLRQPVAISRLTISLINVTRWDPIFPKYVLHRLDIPGKQNDAQQPIAPYRL